MLMLAGGAAFAKPQIAVLGLEVVDKSGSPTPTDARVAEELTHELRNRASQPNGPYSLAPNGDKELIDLTLVKQCDEEKPTCMQGIGKDLNADILLYGHIEKQGASYQVTMYLFDVGQRKRDKTYPETIPLSETSSPALAGWARKIYGKLTGQNDACTILVKTNGVDAGTILVNGSPKGNITNGVGQVGGLGEGRYRIAVEAKDYRPWEKPDVTCTAGQTTTVPADMEREEVASPGGPGSTGPIDGRRDVQVSQSGHGPWLVVAVGAGAVAVGALATGIYASNKLHDTNYGHDCVTDNNGNITGDMNHPGLNGVCSDGPTYRTLQYPMYIGAGVLAGVAAVAVYELLHHNDDEHPSAVVGRRKHRDPFVVVPVATPDGGGVTFSMTW
ncbi:MAG TPA: carboxypeptidase-like regulatory domain-containing protein [Kofleriaceae bacterium]